MSQSSSTPGARGGTPAPGICIVDGCMKIWQSRQLCPTHYQRWRRHGDPAAVGRPVYAMHPAELVRLRRMVGVPASGPTRRMVHRWNRQEKWS